MTNLEKVNFPRYVLDHLCWAINEATVKGRKQVPYGRLLSEIFYQGRVLDLLRRTRDASDKCFEVSTAEKTISSKTLHSMHLFKTAPKDEKWLEMTTEESEIIRDFPSIVKESNPEHLARLVAEYVLEEDASSQEEAALAKGKGKKAKAVAVSEAAVSDAPKGKRARTSSESDAAPTKGKRARTSTESEAAVAKTKK